MSKDQFAEDTLSQAGLWKNENICFWGTTQKACLENCAC